MEIDFRFELWSRGLGRFLMLLALGGLFPCGALLSAAELTRTYQLEQGWNAIYLDIEPSDDGLETVFEGGIVDVVARYFVPSTPVRFIENSMEQPWNMPGWSVWYSPQRAESFLSTLHAAQGGAAYLVHAVKAGALQVKGTVFYRPLEWAVDAYNLTGFPVEATGMTFAQYFAGSENRVGSKVYRLKKGSWEKVSNLATTPIRPGEACWVYCDGNTNYAGPFEVSIPAMTGLNLSDRSSAVVVDLRNRGNAPFSVMVGIEANEGLPLYRREINISQLKAESRLLTPAAIMVGNLSAGEVLPFRLELRRELLSAGAGALVRSAILKFTTSTGVVMRVPVHYKPD